MKRATLEQLLAERQAERPVVLATRLADGRQWLLRPGDEAAPHGLDASTWEAAREAVCRDRSATVNDPSGDIFLHVFNPPLRLIVVGAVHVAQALAPMAAIAGFEVTLVDPRKAFASDARFPGVEMRFDWPDEALRALAPGRRTAVVTLTHDPKLDDPALAVALGSDAVYIGALGSRRTHQKRLARLRERGFSEAELDRIHGPVGLDIGARTPAEIAIAILAQVVREIRLGGADERS